MAAVVEPITGRYVRVDIGGVTHRVYVEQAGSGVPLLCLHTAGADTRQFRGVMNDDEVLNQCRVVTFDLPWHGKSSPPAGWHDTTYQLTASRYSEIVVAIIDALDLDRPIVMGCSIGGREVLYLAADHADRIGGVIGLQSGGHVDPYYDTEWLNRPDVHGGLVCAGVVSGLISPTAPDSERWETLWHYMQGGPGVFQGDLYFYKIDGDVRDRLAAIDTDRCPVFLLTGEYDYSCTPDDTLGVRKSVVGSHATIMSGLGHFPMSEDYERFGTYFRSTLTAALAERERLLDGGEPA
ncbi:MAG TPA: alpha/beta hydrolase [Pseudonocardiaceae bacterium]|jgi:pimeloyl-ACP methyl ester carboxylesterase